MTTARGFTPFCQCCTSLKEKAGIWYNVKQLSSLQVSLWFGTSGKLSLETCKPKVPNHQLIVWTLTFTYFFKKVKKKMEEKQGTFTSNPKMKTKWRNLATNFCRKCLWVLSLSQTSAHVVIWSTDCGWFNGVSFVWTCRSVVLQGYIISTLLTYSGLAKNFKANLQITKLHSDY